MNVLLIKFNFFVCDDEKMIKFIFWNYWMFKTDSPDRFQIKILNWTNKQTKTLILNHSKTIIISKNKIK